MRPEAPDTAVLHLSDMHFNEPEVFEPVYGSEEVYREHASRMLDELAEGIDVAWFSGDCGDEQDWADLEEYMDRFEDSVTIPGNSDDHDEMDYHEHDDEDVSGQEELLANTATDELDIEDGPTYRILHSHDPRHVGVPSGDMDGRELYLDSDDQRLGNSRRGG